MVLPESGVLPALSVPERVKDWLTTGVVVEAVTEREGVRVVFVEGVSLVACQNKNPLITSTTATTITTFLSANIPALLEPILVRQGLEHDSTL
jgi:hypothetical protein